MPRHEVAGLRSSTHFSLGIASLLSGTLPPSKSALTLCSSTCLTPPPSPLPLKVVRLPTVSKEATLWFTSQTHIWTALAGTRQVPSTTPSHHLHQKYTSSSRPLWRHRQQQQQGASRLARVAAKTWGAGMAEDSGHGDAKYALGWHWKSP